MCQPAIIHKKNASNNSGAVTCLLICFLVDQCPDFFTLKYGNLDFMKQKSPMVTSPVSYTHLDVYKRQYIKLVKICKVFANRVYSLFEGAPIFSMSDEGY